jgi:hypothetical protein
MESGPSTNRMLMGLSVGERVNRVTTRLAVLTFGISLGIFESELLRRLARLRGKGRAPLAPRAGDGGPVVRPAEAHSQTALPRGTAATPASTSRASVPIVFLHQNNSEHLAHSLAQAKRSNPDSTVFLLGDDSNNQYAGVKHYQLRDYFTGASQFAAVYKHYSTHSPAFELICFQRWFILREFLAAHKIDRCVYLDSDVLLYANVTDDMEKFRRFDFTLCWNIIGCVFFLTHREGLERLCRFMMDLYAKKDKYQYDRIVAHFAARQKHGLPGGACDMTALQLYNEANFGRVGEASHIIDGSVYDPNINMPHPGFEMENDIKKVVWENGFPYGTYLPTGEKIRFNSLHFNGQHAKSLMSRYCTAAPGVSAPLRATTSSADRPDGRVTAVDGPENGGK